MLERGAGRIVIISSIGAITPMPKSSIYASAKAGVYAYGRSLNEELREKDVSVTVSLPGYVRTNAHRRAGLTHLETQIPEWMWVTPEQVVKRNRNCIIDEQGLRCSGTSIPLGQPVPWLKDRQPSMESLKQTSKLKLNSVFQCGSVRSKHKWGHDTYNRRGPDDINVKLCSLPSIFYVRSISVFERPTYTLGIVISNN